MKKLLGILVLGLLWCNTAFAERVKSIHGFSFELPNGFIIMNNFNIKDSIALAEALKDENRKKMLEALEKQFQIKDFDYLFFEKGGGDNIGITSMVTKSNATVQQSNIEVFCDAQLQMITDMSKKLHKKKVSEYNCDIYKYPNGSKWSVITSYTNVFTIYPTHAYSVEFVHPSNLYKRYILNLTCGPNYCDQLKEKFYEIIQSINFE